MMTTWRLRETVTLRGCDWFGRPAALIIAPNGGNEWWWNGSRISPELLTPMWRGVALAAHSHRLLEIEHLGALRHLGLRGISLYGKGWPPHYGRAFDMWEAVRPACHTVQDPVPWVTVREPVHWTYPGQRGDVLVTPRSGHGINQTCLCTCKFPTPASGRIRAATLSE